MSQLTKYLSCYFNFSKILYKVCFYNPASPVTISKTLFVIISLTGKTAYSETPLPCWYLSKCNRKNWMAVC